MDSSLKRLFAVILSSKFFKKMDPIQAKTSVIEFKKKFEHIVIYYLQSRNLTYKTIQSVKPEKTRIEVNNLTSEDAFCLGAQVQVLLLDGEYLI